MPMRVFGGPVASAYGFAFVLACFAVGCGGNVCTDKEEYVAQCLGSDDDVEAVEDADCPDDIKAEAECILDKSCADVNSGKAYTDCAKK